MRIAVNYMKVLPLVLGSVLLTACAGQSAVKLGLQAPEQRAVDRWQLVIDGKHAEAYDYLSPGARELQSRENYAAAVASRPVTYLAVEPADKSCDDANLVCTVVSRVTFSVISGLQGVGKMQAS